MSGWLLAAVLSAAEVSASEAITAREDARLRWGVAGIAAGGIGLGYFAGGLGLGVGAELGAVLTDRWSLVTRLNLSTVLMASVASLAVAVELNPSDHWGVSLGAGASYIGGMAADLPAVVSLVAPLRVMFSPHVRAARRVSRLGLQLFLEAQVGYELAGSRGLATTRRSPSVSLAGVLGVGFGSW